jgi:hypothetical protein
MMDEQRVLIKVLRTKSERNGPIVFVYNWYEWPRRVLKERGWLNAEVLYEREATQDDLADHANSMRCRAYIYKSISSLIADESLYGVDAGHLMDTWNQQ